MKILDRYILTTYLKTFFSVFIILMLIFILQTVWLYIKELAGKDLDPSVIIKFLIYFLPKLIPLVLPLTILLTSIMVFGSFAENYEFAAMKSTGISLQRAMHSLSIFIVGLGITIFFFANNAIPWAEINSYNLRKNIAKLKPATFIASGQFNQLGKDFNIKVEEKSGDRGQYLEKVTIHKGTSVKGKHSTIISKTGELISGEESDVIKLVLYDGNYYEGLPAKGIKNRNKKPFLKSSFKKYTINIDLSDINNVDLDEKSKTDRYTMLNIAGLDKSIDSLIVKQHREQKAFSKNLFQKSNINTKKKEDKDISKKKDSTINESILDVFDLKKKKQLANSALKSIKNSKRLVDSKIKQNKVAKSLFNKHIISYHEKFALGFACIILFFVGAPLGALIRKGGIGLPMVIAILIFLTYHFIGIFATNSAKNGEFNPVLASWFSTLIMLPLSIYLTRRATADKNLFEIGNIIEPIKKVLNIKKKDQIDYTFLSSLNNEQLLDVIANYKSLGHDENCRFEAINILKNRNQSITSLRESGKLTIKSNYETSEKIILNYKDHSKFAIVLYSIGAILLLLFFVFKNNKLPSLASASIQISFIAFFLYIIYYIKSLVNLFNFYSYVEKKENTPNLVVLIIALPLYIFVYPFLKVKTKEDLKQNCLDSLK